AIKSTGAKRLTQDRHNGINFGWRILRNCLPTHSLQKLAVLAHTAPQPEHISLFATAFSVTFSCNDEGSRYENGTKSISCANTDTIANKKQSVDNTPRDARENA